MGYSESSTVSLREQVFAYIKEKYKTEPEYLWRRYPDYAVFRHSDNRKWFGVVMGILRSRLGLLEDGWTDILNVKIDDVMFGDILVRQPGYFRGYHMAKGSWISILLDGTVPLEEVCEMIDISFLATASRQKKLKMRPPKEWIIPANPAYYDIIHAFDDKKIIDWKQGSGIKTGDTVYIYVGAPVSAVMYKCKVLETDIPYHFQNENLTIRALMKIRVEKRYAPDRFTFDVLSTEFGVRAVRGPRGIPDSLSEALKR